MRTILFSVMNNLIPPFALLDPIGSVLFQARALIRPTTTEIVAFIAGAVLAGVFSVALSALKGSTTSLTEVRHD